MCNNAKEYRINNLELVRQREAEYRLEHIGEIREYDRKRGAEKRSRKQAIRNIERVKVQVVESLIGRECVNCGELKPTTDFTNKNRKHWCNDCVKLDNCEYHKEHYKINSSVIRETTKQYYEDNKETVLIKQKEYNKHNWIAISLNGHKNKGITILTTQEELVGHRSDITHCDMCGVLLSNECNTSMGNSPTLDRMNNEMVMDKNNTMIVCHDCNTMKSNRTLEEYLNFLKIVREKTFVIPTYDPNIQVTYGTDSRLWALSTHRNHNRNGNLISATSDQIQNIFEQTPICPICGCQLEHGVGKLHSRSPTLDRITNKETDLTIDDLWVICHRCNLSKRQFTLSEWKSYAEKVCKRFNVI